MGVGAAATGEGATVVIDLGGTYLRLGHLLHGEPHPEGVRVATEALRRSEPVGFLAAAVRGYAAARGLELKGVVLGVPFTPDKERTTAVSSPNIRNLEGAPLKHGLEAALGCPVVLERDINLLLLGEWHAGAARGAGAVFGLFAGTGVGGCLLEDGRPYRGATGAATELGHIPVRHEGRRCVCGNEDCLEAYASGHVLLGLAETAGVPVGELFTHAHDPALREALESVVDDLARALATAVNLFHPDLALVGGGVPEMPGFPKARFSGRFYAHLRRPVPAETVRLAWAELGWRAALHGAQVLPREAVAYG